MLPSKFGIFSGATCGSVSFRDGRYLPFADAFFSQEIWAFEEHLRHPQDEGETPDFDELMTELDGDKAGEVD